MQREEVKQYLHEIVWRYHTPVNSYDVDAMAADASARFAISQPEQASVRELARDVARTHCPQCGSSIHASSRECFCCGWVALQP